VEIIFSFSPVIFRGNGFRFQISPSKAEKIKKFRIVSPGTWKPAFKSPPPLFEKGGEGGFSWFAGGNLEGPAKSHRDDGFDCRGAMLRAQYRARAACPYHARRAKTEE